MIQGGERMSDLSDKGKENLRKNAESRKKESKYVKLDPGENRILHFDAEKMGPVEVEFDGIKKIRYQYTVTYPDDPDQQEKYFTLGTRDSPLFDKLLSEGKSILNVHRIGGDLRAYTMNAS
jgi:hypothetical protein